MSVTIISGQAAGTCLITRAEGARAGRTPPRSPFRRGQDYAASRPVCPKGVAAIMSIRHNPGFGIATKVMRRNPRNTGRRGVALEQLPDDLFAERHALNLAPAVHGPEYVAVSDTHRTSPRIDRHLRPGRHRHRPNPPVLPDKVPAHGVLMNDNAWVTTGGPLSTLTASAGFLALLDCAGRWTPENRNPTAAPLRLEREAAHFL
jgi:hypothetical protein